MAAKSENLVVDEFDDFSAVDDSNSKIHKKLMEKATKHYYKSLKEQTKKVRDDEEEIDDEQIWDDENNGQRETGDRFVNPYLEVFNVAATMAGVYPFETSSDKERERLQKLPEPIFFMEDPGDVDKLEEEMDMVMDDRGKGKTELVEMPKDIIRRLPVTRHLQPEVVTRLRGVDNTVDFTSHEMMDQSHQPPLPPQMKLHIREMVDTHIEKWSKSGIFKNADKQGDDEVEKLARKLQEEACLSLVTQVQDYISGKTRIDQPLPATGKMKKARATTKSTSSPRRATPKRKSLSIHNN